MGLRKRRIWRLTRSGDINSNPSVIEQRASTFAAGATATGPATLVVTRDEDGLAHWAMMPDTSRIDSAALSLAHCVAGRLEPQSDPPDLRFGPVAGQLRWKRTHASIRNTQSGADLSEVSRILGDTLPVDSWVAAVVRGPRIFESRRWSNWLAYRMSTRRPTHHSTAPNALVTTIWAGSTSMEATRSILETVASSLPGFDLGTRVVRPQRFGLTAITALLAGLALAAAYFGLLPWLMAAAVATPLLAFGVGAAARLLPTREARVHRGLATAKLPAPRSRKILPGKPGKVDVDDIKAESHFAGGRYPLHKEAFVLGPHIPAAIIAPQAGVLSGVSATKDRQVAMTMTRRIGPMVGTTEQGQQVYLSARDLGRGGLAVLGEPGSGKSVLVLGVMAWSMLERVMPSGLAHYPGASNCLVHFETKLDGARNTLNWAHAIGDKMLLVEVANPASPAIDLLDVPGNVEERALHFTNAMQYAFADGSIKDESFRTLKIVITGGLVVDDEIAAQIPGVDTGRSPLYYASVLMGRLGDTTGAALASAIHAKHEHATAVLGQSASDATLAWEALALMYGSTVTPSQRAGLQRAPGNKIDQLLALDHYFAPARKKVTWRQILEGHRAVVILTGADSAGNMMEANMSSLMSAMLMFSLRYNIERICAGWEEQNRWVSIFADELKDLAGASPDIITWLRDRGRSYGVRLNFATQRPRQLDNQVREALLSFANLVAFTQSNRATAEELVADFAGDGSEWSPADVLTLPPYQAIVRASVGYQRQQAFLVKSAYFAGADGGVDIESFLAAQGYEDMQGQG